MRTKRALSGAVALALGCLLSGCQGVYYGGPEDSDEPHAVVRPGVDLTIWAVDGQPTTRHSFEVLVAPGRRRIGVRIEHPVESESATPFERKDVLIDCKDGVTYHLERKVGRESVGPPYEVSISEARFR